MQTQATLTCFEGLGIQSQKCGKQPSIPDILDCECHQIPDYQLRYDERFSHFIVKVPVTIRPMRHSRTSGKSRHPRAYKVNPDLEVAYLV